MSVPLCATRWPPDPSPGDFAVVPNMDIAGVLISAAEDAEALVKDRTVLAGREWRHWDHAFIYLGDNKVGEAEPHGFRIRDLHQWGPELYGGFARWSSGTILLTAAQRAGIVAGARALAGANYGRGIGYSYLDYLAIAAHDLHIPVPGLRRYVASSGHMICSQAVDFCYAQAGVALFSDGRWPGYVDPADLARLLWDWPAGTFAPGTPGTGSAQDISDR